MRGKCVLITGATNGIGKAAALDLAKMGAEVLIVGRDEVKTRAVLQDLVSSSGNTKLDFLLGDLSSFDDVRAIAIEYLSRHDRLDVLLNNAGAAFSEFRASADGYEMTFALNHISYYLLTLLLLDTLKKTAAERGEARIVNVSSSAHFSARDGIRLDNLRDSGGSAGFRAYSNSKLANVLFTYQLARRLEGTGVAVNALHPGFVNTGFGHNMKGITGLAVKVLQRLIARTPEKGAETLVYLASSSEVAGLTGKYWKDKTQERSSEISYDREQQRRLWEFSAAITGVE
ncbi:MAG: SDR family oxidoreductase [Chloroflexi bacterium]|nr:SDR family oxidoreductase [Chloroflexota bacterium]